MSTLEVGGIVLCGGQSKRMGRPKAWLSFGRESSLARVVRLVNEVVSPVVVVAAPGQEVPPLPTAIQIVRDEERGRGPLQGLAAGLLALRGKVEAVFLSSCDVPFLRPAFIRRMIELLGDRLICIARVGDYHHPLAAVYRLEVADTVARLLSQNQFRPVSLIDRLPTRIVEAAELADVDPHFRSLWNLNTPEDYQKALQEMETEQAI